MKNSNIFNMKNNKANILDKLFAAAKLSVLVLGCGPSREERASTAECKSSASSNWYEMGTLWVPLHQLLLMENVTVIEVKNRPSQVDRICSAIQPMRKIMVIVGVKVI